MAQPTCTWKCPTSSACSFTSEWPKGTESSPKQASLSTTSVLPFLTERPEIGQPSFSQGEPVREGENHSATFYFSPFLGPKRACFLLGSSLCHRAWKHTHTHTHGTNVKEFWKQYSVAWLAVMSIWTGCRSLSQRSHG